jgi:hypothetical protein
MPTPQVEVDRIPRDKGVPLTAKCLCSGGHRRVPIHLRVNGLFAVRGHLKTLPSANLVVLTYRCRDCTTDVEITAGDLLLSETSS